MFNNKNNENKYLIACSGGPDSMALLEMARLSNSYIEVAHVNYHKRDSALRDQKIVKNYCKKYNIRFHLLNVYPNDVKGNFQQYARNARYDFFSKLVRKHKLNAVLVAHHMDDFIETYLLQKEKNIGVSYYGISKYSNIKNTLIIRPLLKYQKTYLVNYCDKNNIAYGIDESNLSNNYARNRIRHKIVEKMSNKDKKKLVKEINDLNKTIEKENMSVISFLKKDEFDAEEFLNYKYFSRMIRHIFDENLSNKFIDDIKKKLDNKNNIIIERNNVFLTKEYGKITYFYKPYDYEFKLNRLMYGKYDNFEIRKDGNNFNGVTITKNDFPITIRNYKEGDSIKMRYGTKKINRFFIDNKIRYKDRLVWPIVLNSSNIAILVPGIGCDKDHYSEKHNLHVIKL